ncbi:MAG TPA: DUF433 domain-containing protein [Pyrinomonadaceae bacterium]|nr:DUF433 domain-containing protein [Pyrinomonadaceae bacterium]
MSTQYVEQVEGAYRVAGSRVSLDSVVYAFLNGQSPESITESFPALSLEQVYGAITFYLANREKIDAYLREGEEKFEALRRAGREANPLLYKKLEESRRQLTQP